MSKERVVTEQSRLKKSLVVPYARHYIRYKLSSYPLSYYATAFQWVYIYCTGSVERVQYSAASNGEKTGPQT